MWSKISQHTLLHKPCITTTLWSLWRFSPSPSTSGSVQSHKSCLNSFLALRALRFLPRLVGQLRRHCMSVIVSVPAIGSNHPSITFCVIYLPLAVTIPAIDNTCGYNLHWVIACSCLSINNSFPKASIRYLPRLRWTGILMSWFNFGEVLYIFSHKCAIRVYGVKQQ